MFESFRLSFAVGNSECLNHLDTLGPDAENIIVEHAACRIHLFSGSPWWLQVRFCNNFLYLLELIKVETWVKCKVGETHLTCLYDAFVFIFP